MSQKVAGLKREFQEKDVERIRNLVKGKGNEKTFSSVGFTKAQDFYEEGDIWESDNRTWTIKNGIKQNITKLDKAKKAHNVPLLCPKCKKVMKNRNDKPFYNIHKMCFNCVIDFEHELQKTGKLKEYQRKIKNDEIDNRIKEFKFFVKEKLNESNNSFIAENGDVERWIGELNTDKVEEHSKNVIEYLESLKT